MRVAFVFAAFLLVSAGEALAQAPANDEPAGAETIPAAGPFPHLTGLVDIAGASTVNDPLGPPPCANPSAHSVWYRFQVATSANYTFSTTSLETGTTVGDTTLAIYSSTGGAAGTFTQLACDNGLNQGRVAIALTGGQDIFVGVWETGAGTPTPGLVQVRVIQTAPNDNASNAEVIPAAGPFPHYTNAAFVSDATTQPGLDPVPPASCTTATTVARTLWYRFTPAVSGAYGFATASEMEARTTLNDTIIGIFTSAGGASGPFTLIGCNDDGGSFESLHSIVFPIPLTAGTEYWIVTYQFGTATPAFANDEIQLLIFKAAPPNDNVAGAISVGVDTAVTGILSGAANDYQVLTTSPAFSGAGQTGNVGNGPDVVYSFTAPTAGTYQVRVSQMRDNRPLLYVATALPAGPPPLTVPDADLLAAANRNTAAPGEEIQPITLAAGQQVFIVVDTTAIGTTSGENTLFVLEVNRAKLEVEPNGTPAAATPISYGITGAITPANDIDFFKLGAPPAGSRVFAIVDGVAANSNSVDIRVTTTTDTLERDTAGNDIGFGTSSSHVAGTPTTGTETFLRIANTSTTVQSEPYRVYAVVQGPIGSATLEGEPNGTFSTADSGALYWSGTLSGTLPSTDIDIYAFDVTAGEVIFIALDGDPTRNNTPLNAAMDLIDPANRMVLTVNDGQASSSITTGAGSLTATTPNSPGEALTWRAQLTGTYFLRVFTGSTSTTTGGGDYLLSIQTTTPPELSVSGSLNPFIATGINSPSAEQSYQVNGVGLTGPVSVVAPAPFEVRPTAGVFGPTATLTPSGGGIVSEPVFVRYNPQAGPGPHSGTITHNSPGTFEATIGVTGDLILTPTIQLGGASFQLFRAAGGPSPAQSYTVTGLNLSSSVTITPPSGFETAVNGGAFQAGVRTIPQFNGTVSAVMDVRYAPATATVTAGLIVHESAGATTETASVSGFVPVEASSVASVPAGGIAIPDSNTTGISSTIQVTAGGVVTNVRVRNMTIFHDFDGDLDIFLIGPNLSQIILSQDNGGADENYIGTTFDDAATPPIASGTAPFSGTFKPFNPLSTFNGITAAGAWTLKVVDDAGGDLGSLMGWELEIETTAAPAVPAGTLAVVFPQRIDYSVVNGQAVFGPSNFGKTAVGTTAPPLGLRIDNGGSAPLNITPLSNGGAGAAHFTSTLAQQSIPAGGSATFEVRFTPTSVGVHDAQVRFDHDAAGVTTPFAFSVRGEGAAGTFLTQHSLDLPVHIPGTPANVTISSTLDIAAPAGGGGLFVVDLQVTIAILHEIDAHLDIFLESPQGIQIALAEDRTGEDFFVTTFDDQAATSINSGTTPYNGTFRPSDPLGLAAFFNESAIGTWKLVVRDDTSGTGGVLVGWSLEILYSPVAPSIVEVRDVASNTVLLKKGTAGAIPLDFGNVALGAPGTRQIRIANAGVAGATMTVTADPAANPSTDFDVVTGAGQFPAVIASGGSQTFDVVFNPFVTGLFTADVSFSHDASSPASPFVFEVKGRGVAQPPVVIAATGLPQAIPNTGPGQLDSTINIAQNGPVDFIVVRNVNITHDALEDLTISLIHGATTVVLFDERGGLFDNLGNVTFDDGAAAQIATATPAGVPPAFTGAFRPEQALTAFQGANANGAWTLRIVDDLGGTVGSGTLDSWTLEVIVGGTPQIQVFEGGLTGAPIAPGGTVAFGTRSPGAPVTIPIFIQNPGNAGLNVSSVSFLTNPNNAFALDMTGFTPLIPQNGSSSFGVSFTPSAVQSFQGTIRIIHTGTGTVSPIDIDVTGTGGIGTLAVIEGPLPVPSGTIINFASQPTGNGPTAPRSFTVRNSGTSTLNVTSIGVTGARANEYFIVGTPPTSLAPNESGTVTVTFDPATTGASTAILTIAHDGTNNPYQINLTGTGLASVTVGGQTGGSSGGGGGGGGCVAVPGAAEDPTLAALLALAAAIFALRRAAGRRA